jgi:hypothetical protein
MPEQKKVAPRAGPAAAPVRKAAIPAAVLAAAALAAHFAEPQTERFEGVKSDGHGNAVSYVDRLGKGQPVTMCFGQTGFIKAPNGHLIKVTLGLKFPIAHCRKVLEENELGYAIPIWRVTPGIADYPHTGRPRSTSSTTSTSGSTRARASRASSTRATGSPAATASSPTTRAPSAGAWSCSRPRRPPASQPRRVPPRPPQTDGEIVCVSSAP